MRGRDGPGASSRDSRRDAGATMQERQLLNARMI